MGRLGRPPRRGHFKRREQHIEGLQEGNKPKKLNFEQNSQRKKERTKEVTGDKSQGLGI